MAATAEQVARLRRMVNESTTETYSDDLLAEYIERYPCVDERGEAPYTWDTSDEPPTEDENEDWLPTYDLNAAAADVWEEKAAVLAGDYDFSGDGASFKRSQGYEQHMRQARFYRSRRNPRTVTQRPEPDQAEDVIWIGNLAEVDD